MKNKLFNYAKKLVKYLVMTGSTDNREYWEFKFPDGESLPIEFEQTEEGMLIRCKCKFCSMRDSYHNSANGRFPSPFLCSFKISLLIYKGKY